MRKDRQEHMSTIYAITNQKGGVSKSTTAVILTAGLHKAGKKVLLIDLDQQANATAAMGEKPSAEESALQILTREKTAAECIRHTEQGDLIPAGKALAGADLILTQTGKEFRLREALKQIRDRYDFIVLDTPPALGTLTVNALTAATDLIIPANADIFSLTGITDLAATLEGVREYTNPDLKIDGILFTQFSGRPILSRDMLTTAQGMAAWLKTKVFETKIRQSTTVKELQSNQTSIFDYAPKAPVTNDCRTFIKELSGVEVPAA